MSRVSVTLDAKAEKGGRVACHLACDGRKVKVVFTPDDIIVSLPDGDGSLTLDVSERGSSTAEGQPAGS